MLTLILSILDTQAKLLTVLINSQTPEQQKILWDRYIEATEPLHRLLGRIVNRTKDDDLPKDLPKGT